MIAEHGQERRGPVRVVILGGGFGGLHAALELEKGMARRSDLEVTLVNRENFFLFTPMLHEVAASDLDNDTTDGLPAPAPTYAIAGGADANAFEIDPATGALSLKQAGDFETQNVYEGIVSSTDGQGAVSEQTIAVTVTDVVEAPSAVTLTPVAVGENIAGAVVAVIAIEGGDGGYGAADVILLGDDAA